MAEEVSRPLVFLNTDVTRTTRKVRRSTDNDKTYPVFEETVRTDVSADIVTVVADAIGSHEIVRIV